MLQNYWDLLYTRLAPIHSSALSILSLQAGSSDSGKLAAHHPPDQHPSHKVNAYWGGLHHLHSWPGSTASRALP